MSAAAASPDSVPASPEFESIRVAYGTIVWQQLRQNRLAVFGLWCIGALFALAVYAPLLFLDAPFVFRDAQGTHFPFFSALFNRLLFENAVDIFFNLLLLLLPFFALIYGGARRHYGAYFSVHRMRLLGWLLLVQMLVFVALLPKTWFGLENPVRHQAALTDWSAEESRLEAQGESVFALFPINRINYRDTDPAETVQPPSARHWLGTDLEGRDVAARMLFGTRISLTIGVVAVSIYVLIGVILGALAGYFGGWIDSLISRAIEVMICFPSFFLILTLASFVENRSIFHVMVIIGITSWTGVARLIRAEFLRHKELEYAQAARALGIPKRRIIFGHILPNAIAPVLVTATFGVASAILTESSLAFLGLGDVSAPSWGETLNSGRIEEKLWLILAPGLAIFFVVSVFNLVGEGLRDALDPKLRS